ncbi:hypothetical protein HKD37_13G038165 [Glycine soja]
MRKRSTVKGALAAKHQNAIKYKKNKNFDGTRLSSTSTLQKEIGKILSALPTLWKEKGILHSNAGKDLMLSVMSVIKWGHEVVICKNRNQLHNEAAKVVDPEEEYLFPATCFSSIESNDKFITMNGKGTVAISTNRGTQLIYDVLYVLEIDQNLLSVG